MKKGGNHDRGKRGIGEREGVKDDAKRNEIPVVVVLKKKRITVGVDDGLLAKALVSGARGVGSFGEVDVAGGNVDGDLALCEGADQGLASLLVTGKGLLGLRGGSNLSRDGGNGDKKSGKKGC